MNTYFMGHIVGPYTLHHLGYFNFILLVHVPYQKWEFNRIF